jgi:hypothetical protein
MNNIPDHPLAKKTSWGHLTKFHTLSKHIYKTTPEGNLHIYLPPASTAIPIIIIAANALIWPLALFDTYKDDGLTASLIFTFILFITVLVVVTTKTVNHHRHATSGKDDIILHPTQKLIFFGKQQDLYTAVQFKMVGAIQILEKLYTYTKTNQGRTRYITATAYEVNLILHSGERTTIIDSTQKDLVLKLANDFATHLKVPLWDIYGLNG